MNLLYPKLEFNKVYDIPFEQLYERGIRGIIFDIDNTLVKHGKPADELVIKLFKSLHDAGISTCLMSNNKKKRVEPFAYQVNSMYIYKADKPKKKSYFKAMNLMNTKVKSTIFVGDQIFTDIYGANRIGIFTILVKPVHPNEEIQIVIKRKLEAIVLYFYHKGLKKGDL